MYPFFLRVSCFFFCALFASSCALFSSKSGPDYNLMLSLADTDAEADEEVEQVSYDDWKKATSQSSSMALGAYQITATPIPSALVDQYSAQIPDQVSCFEVELAVKTPNSDQARLENFEGLLEDRFGLTYRMYWYVNSFAEHGPTAEDVSGATGSEQVWREEGTLCAFGRVSFEDFFELSISPRNANFPFYGISVRLVWDFEGVEFDEDHPSNIHGKRERKVQRYKGW